MAERRVEKLRERRDVLMVLSSADMQTASDVRRLAGLDTQHPNVTLGHLRWLAAHRLAERWPATRTRPAGWILDWPAGDAAVELLSLTLGERSRGE